MKPSDFQPGFPGRLVDTDPPGLKAFVPDPLPPNLPPDHALVKAHSNARAGVARLEVALPASEFDPYILAYPLMGREAYYSSLIEGTHTTPADMALYELTAPTQPQDAARMQTMEVVNYVRAMELGMEKLKAGHPVSSALIRGLHERLLRGVRGNEATPGDFRKKQNYIGRKIDGIEHARFVPPPPREVEPCMRALDAFIETGVGLDAPLPIFEAIAYVHYQFETIHPFGDGNGRIGRLLVPLILRAKGLLEDPILHLSPVLEKKKEVYMDLMLRVSQRGGWRDWVLFFLGVVEDSATETYGLVQRLRELRKKYVAKVTTPRSPALLRHLIDSLFQRPSITIGRAAAIMDVSHAQAAAHVRRLVSLGILEEITKHKRNMRFTAPEILAVVFGS